MHDLFGTLSIEEVVWIVINLLGLVLATAATFESHLDLEAVQILGMNGARLLKARGNRRDEAIKGAVHAVLMTTGIIVSASPTPRAPYEQFSALWAALAIITVSTGLAVGSVFTLWDRRKLWRLFTEPEPQGSGGKAVTVEQVRRLEHPESED